MERGRIEEQMSIKEDIYRLVDRLPEEELPEARHYLESLLMEHDPLLQVLKHAPIDDEPTTPEEDAGAAEAWEEYRRGEGRPLKDIRAELLRE
jgi:hypothetical protein